MRQKRHALVAALLVVIPLIAGCTGAGGGLTPSATMTTAIQGWERWLRLDWTAQSRPNGQEIDGYVYSNYGSPITDVQLLAQGIDGAGNVVGQKLEWVPGVLPALQRSYFRISALPPAERYRVSVWAFNIVQSKSLP